MRDTQTPLFEAHVLQEVRSQHGIEVGKLAGILNVPVDRLALYLAALASRRLLSWSGWSPARPNSVPAATDIVVITRQGRARTSELEREARRRVVGILDGVSAEDHRHLVEAMATIERILPQPVASPVVEVVQPRAGAAGARTVIRPHYVGDLGYVVHRHAVLYAEEYGWDERFEALVARVAAEFIENFRPEVDRAFIADFEGAIVGAAFVVRVDDAITKLRMVYVEPAWRGGGLGRRLVEEAMAFARASGAKRMTLWTNDVLADARTLYEKFGFRLVASEPYEGFGKSLVGETWEREL
jgi:GNAT superfamily N-acetyltransferase